MEALDRLYDAMAEDSPVNRLTPFVGSGVSVAATDGNPHASWSGLLLDGIEVCERLFPGLPLGWADQRKGLLVNADMHSFIALAEDIGPRLRKIRGGREFGTWMRRTVGGLRATPEGLKLLAAVRGLGELAGRQVVTTNYDILVELESSWSARTWTDEAYRTSIKDDKIVVHLHGVWDKPGTVVLSGGDYERLRNDEKSAAVGRALFLSNRFLFIGCGDGLLDPDIGPLITFLGEAKFDQEHYLLVRGRQLRQLLEHPLSSNIAPVAYGDEFADLRPFLEQLAQNGRAEVSQDPRFYEHLSAARPASLLDLVRVAQKKLQGALDVLDRAGPAIREIEDHILIPDEMRTWDPDVQEPFHERRAAALTDPAAQLESCLDQVVPVFEEAESGVWQFTAPKFARLADWVAPVTERVATLADASGQLFGKVTRARDDLRIRADVHAGYQASYRAVERAQANIERAAGIASSLLAALSSLQEGQAPGGPVHSPLPPAGARLHVVPPAQQGEASARSPRDAPPPGPENDPDAPPPERGAASTDTGVGRPPDTPSPEHDKAAQPRFRSVPLFGEVGAGNPLDGDQVVTEYLALPAQYVRGEEVFMLQVRGDSMTGEDGVLEKDYVIIDRGARRENGDMVLAYIAEDNGCTIKRLWQEGGSARLESSKPGLGPMPLAPDDVIQGKVVGVVRWYVSKARRRTDSAS
jgi:SOS-response transcriptional repressor LexA